MWSQQARKVRSMLSSAGSRCATVVCHSPDRRLLSSLENWKTELAYLYQPNLATLKRRIHSVGSLQCRRMVELSLLNPDNNVIVCQEQGRRLQTVCKEPISIYSDAHPLYGFGCVLGNRWASGRWTEECYNIYSGNTLFYETYAVLCGIEAFGPSLAAHHVHFYCDHSGVVQGVNNACKSKESIRILVLKIKERAHNYGMHLEVKPIYSRDKKHNPFHQAADALSRRNRVKFRNFRPNAEAMPTKLPSYLDMIKPDLN